MPHASGGIEYYIHHLALGLKARGHAPSVVLPAYPDDQVKEPYTFEGIPVLRHPGYPAEGKWQIAGLEPNETLAHFRRLLEAEKPDIVHFNQLTNSGGISLQHLQAAREAGARVVYTSHMAEFLCQRGDLMQRGTQRCNGVIAPAKCADCLLASRGMNGPLRGLLLAGDWVWSRLKGTGNFKAQMRPLTLPGFAARWHIHKIRSVIRESDAFVSIARWSTALLKKNNWYGQQCHTIPTGLFEHASAELPEPAAYNGKGHLKLLYMGRVVAEKGLKVLLQAVLQMDPERIALDVYGPAGLKGSAVYLEECRAMSADAPNIRFFPRIPVNEVPAVMRQYHLLCLPSTGNEMAPLVIQEAMDAGLPVVGSDLPAISEWIENGRNGLLFKTGDAASLRTALQGLLDSPCSLDDFRKQLKPPARFSSVVDNYELLYRRLLEHS